MNKMLGSIMLVGALLVSGAGAGEPLTIGTTAPDPLRLPPLDSPITQEALFGGIGRDWAALGITDEANTLVVALDAPSPAPSSPSIGFQANNTGARVAVKQEFSTWSDLTAMFRPSRWMSPFAAGGTLSWLNYKAWRDEPGRTGKVLLGEAIVVGAGYAIYEATRSSDSDSDSGGDTASAPSKTSSTSSSRSRSSSSSGGGSSSGGSSSGGSTGVGDAGGGDGYEKPW